jgi:hypothetical protein
MLTKRGAQVLQQLEHLMDNASRALVSSPPAAQRGANLQQPTIAATAADGPAPSRGN